MGFQGGTALGSVGFRASGSGGLGAGFAVVAQGLYKVSGPKPRTCLVRQFVVIRGLLQAIGAAMQKMYVYVDTDIDIIYIYIYIVLICSLCSTCKTPKPKLLSPCRRVPALGAESHRGAHGSLLHVRFWGLGFRV